MTDIEQLEKHAQWLELYSHDLMEEGSLDCIAEKILDISKNIRAHIEAMKQEPVAYLSRLRFDELKAGDIVDGIGTVLWREGGDNRVPLYTAPQPASLPIDHPSVAIAKWLSAALSCENTCAEFKSDIEKWFAYNQPTISPQPAEPPVLKMPERRLGSPVNQSEQEYMFDEAFNYCLDRITAMNPHLKVEEVK